MKKAEAIELLIKKLAYHTSEVAVPISRVDIHENWLPQLSYATVCRYLSELEDKNMVTRSTDSDNRVCYSYNSAFPVSTSKPNVEEKPITAIEAANEVKMATKEVVKAATEEEKEKAYKHLAVAKEVYTDLEKEARENLAQDVSKEIAEDAVDNPDKYINPPSFEEQVLNKLANVEEYLKNVEERTSDIMTKLNFTGDEILKEVKSIQKREPSLFKKALNYVRKVFGMSPIS